jgi:hypothetical protein
LGSWTIKNATPLISLSNFIHATRDSGYRGTYSAVAELVDNAIEANARHVQILIKNDPTFSLDPEYPITIYVVDNGSGMDTNTLRYALQFGGSSRYNSREGLGRFGMGLPNSSMSQTKHVDVYTWTSPRAKFHSYLDVDSIATGKLTEVPKPSRSKTPEHLPVGKFRSGTIVAWTLCDRLSSCRVKVLEKNLHRYLGQMFRRFIQRGHKISINGILVSPFDPLFLDTGSNLTGSRPFGEDLEFTIQFTKANGKQGHSKVVIRFSELPVDKWHNLPNKDKRTHRISKNAGVSILRANREIDFGWHFMGSKRKENYDDWWRCEISFKPALDELFGVTHTKQSIRPTEELKEILTPNIEAIAHKLNYRIRTKFSKVKTQPHEARATDRAKAVDPSLSPPTRNVSKSTQKVTPYFRPLRQSPIPGLKYLIKAEPLETQCFYVPQFDSKQLTLLINSDHAFFNHVYKPFNEDIEATTRQRAKYELMLLAASRAESLLTSDGGDQYAKELRILWGRVLENFLT